MMFSKKSMEKIKNFEIKMLDEFKKPIYKGKGGKPLDDFLNLKFGGKIERTKQRR